MAYQQNPRSTAATRSSGLLVGVATLKRPLHHGGSFHGDGRSGEVYLSGFRIVQDAAATRHCEYRVVMPGVPYAKWHRFSEIKALARRLQSVGFSAQSKDAWDVVRGCKAPKGRTLDHGHLSRKCLAIERFLSTLMDQVPDVRLAELLKEETAATKTRQIAVRRNRSKHASWGPSQLQVASARAARIIGMEVLR